MFHYPGVSADSAPPKNDEGKLMREIAEDLLGSVSMGQIKAFALVSLTDNCQIEQVVISNKEMDQGDVALLHMALIQVARELEK